MPSSCSQKITHPISCLNALLGKLLTPALLLYEWEWEGKGQWGGRTPWDPPHIHVMFRAYGVGWGELRGFTPWGPGEHRAVWILPFPMHLFHLLGDTSPPAIPQGSSRSMSRAPSQLHSNALGQRESTKAHPMFPTTHPTPPRVCVNN